MKESWGVWLQKSNGGKTVRILRTIRLALSGAFAGAALAGVFLPHDYGIGTDIFGAGAGFLAVLAVKAAHVI